MPTVSYIWLGVDVVSIFVLVWIIYTGLSSMTYLSCFSADLQSFLQFLPGVVKKFITHSVGWLISHRPEADPGGGLGGLQPPVVSPAPGK